MNTKELILPDGWEVKEVIDNKIIVREKEKELPKTWKDCTNSFREYAIYSVLSPEESDNAIKALGKLLIYRNAWWKQLGWKPDWNDQNQRKYCIGLIKGKVETMTNEGSNRILAFPTLKARDQFLYSFRDLIEEAKELL